MTRETEEKTTNAELLRLKTGYNQHASFSMEPACSDVIKSPDLAEFMIHCEKQAFADTTIQAKCDFATHADCYC